MQNRGREADVGSDLLHHIRVRSNLTGLLGWLADNALPGPRPLAYRLNDLLALDASERPSLFSSLLLKPTMAFTAAPMPAIARRCNADQTRGRAGQFRPKRKEPKQQLQSLVSSVLNWL